MKKILLLTAIACLGLASCKKDYVCSCTVSGTSNGVTLTNFPAGSKNVKDTKKKAKKTCDDMSGTDADGFTKTCALN